MPVTTGALLTVHGVAEIRLKSIPRVKVMNTIHFHQILLRLQSKVWEIYSKATKEFDENESYSSIQRRESTYDGRGIPTEHSTPPKQILTAPDDAATALCACAHVAIVLSTHTTAPPPLAAAEEEENEVVVSWVKAMSAADASQHLGCLIAVATDHH